MTVAGFESGPRSSSPAASLASGLFQSSSGCGADDLPLLEPFKGATLLETVKIPRVPPKTMPDANVIPLIDLGRYLAREPGALDYAAVELRRALTEIGFYSIVNHGVPPALVQEVYRQVARFHDQPLDEKLKIKLDKHNVGYLPMMG
ncbi:MAG TPA: 2-oxoglutarate and iron-dependent oxygenase domain-containing protein, partial [Candidatus Acidoferrales bacterium]|nr:2-oxoglutarate and iron-dependent oxygenase domain-containing protein [Candidatus Acidoferrales bacterium]